MLTPSQRTAWAIVAVASVILGCRRPTNQADNSSAGHESPAAGSHANSSPATSNEPSPVAAQQPAASEQTGNGSQSNQPKEEAVGTGSSASGARSSAEDGRPASDGAGAASRGARQPPMPGPEFKSPESAYRYAAARRSTAKRHATDGEEPAAYEAAIEAWSALQPHLVDEECRKLSGELMAEIEKYGEALGDNGHSVVGKLLKIK